MMRKDQAVLLVAIIAGGVAVSALLYLGGTVIAGGISGFPLDDAWIHQTYARNLARDQQWSYEAGQASTGSTAPLWTLALTLGYSLGLDGRLWAFVLGAVALGVVSWLAWRVGIRLFDPPGVVALAAALLCVLEWHLVWAAFSGMETLLFAGLVLLCVDRYLAFEAGAAARRASMSDGSGGPSWLSGLWMGISGALLVLTRPEGLLLLGIIAAFFVWARFRTGRWKSAMPWAVAAVCGCMLFLVPYAAANLKTANFIFPTTFYAKQAEYRTVIESLGLPTRFWRLLLTVWVGPQILLVPGFLFSVGYSLKRRRADIDLLWLWWLGSVAIYALRLPVTYQHGRYLIPTVPIFIVLGTWGTWRLIRRLGEGPASRIVGRAWIVALLLLLLVFWIIGAQAYAQDVAFIYGEMGAMADWLNENVPAQNRLAVHDIGMVGYRIANPFVDLAGLVTPEVIPFIDDETRLLDFMAAEGVAFIVVFPDWSDAYRQMVQDPRLTLVFSTDYQWTRSSGRENLSVYRADWSLDNQLH